MYKIEKTGKGRLTQILADKTNLNSSQIEKTILIANNILLKSLKEEVMKGNIQTVLNMINNESRNDYLSEIIFTEIMVNLVSKVGIDRKNAKKSTQVIYLYIMNLISHKLKNSTTGNIQASNLFDILGINKELHLNSIVNRLDSLINYNRG